MAKQIGIVSKLIEPYSKFLVYKNNNVVKRVLEKISINYK